MSSELGRFFHDQERILHRTGEYAQALRLHTNRFIGYISKYPEVTGVVGLGFPFYLPRNISDSVQITEMNRFTQEKKSTLTAESLQNWRCPTCFSENELQGTRNQQCKNCALEKFKPSDIQKTYIDLDLLCLISGDEQSCRKTAEKIAFDMRMGLFPPLDLDLNASLSQYSAFTQSPYEVPPPLDLHFVRAEEYLEVIKNIGDNQPTSLNVLSAYESLKSDNMPFGMGSLFLSEPVILDQEFLQAVNEKRNQLLDQHEGAQQVLEKIKISSGQVRRMFSQKDMQEAIIEKIASPLHLAEKTILVFGTTMPKNSKLDDQDLRKTEALWRIITAIDLAKKTNYPILFTGFESEEMASWLIAQEPNLAANVFIEPFSHSTEENIRNVVFFENKLMTDRWIGVSNSWHLERIRWVIQPRTGFRFTPYPIEQTMRTQGVSQDRILNFQKIRYEEEATRIQQMTGYRPSFV
ncbi:MAG: hypothetical protein KatS3mg089_0880 [Patescibacteria group bacterium]|nr:MAG: hypothetical protein KatS3mg089_0880 [Patescibacteria group bacterium]